MNPGWSFWLWTDDDNRNLIKDHYPFFLNQYDAYDVKMKRIDSSRLFYIHRYGGVYLDLDFACLQPFDTLPMPPGDAILSHQYTKWLIRQMYGSENKVQPFKAGTIANNFMVAPRGHPLFSYAIRKLPTFANHSLLFATGPNFLSRMVYEHDQLVNHSGIKTHVTQYYLGRIYATGVDTAVDEAKVRKFLRMLRSPNEEDVQRDWWFRDVPLDVFTPYKDDVFANCHPRNGCYWLDPVLVRCSSTPGANRAAAPNHTDRWPLCFELMDVGRATALGPEPLGAAAAPTAASAERPLFYSFGIDNKWDPDDVLGAMGFEVHSFDPTTIKRQVHEQHSAAGVHFHYNGLSTSSTCQGDDAGKSHTGRFYGKLGGELLSMSAIRQRLGHQGRTISAMKIDCEGCEWNVFYEMSRLDPSALDGVAMILTELHMVEQLQMRTEADVRKVQEFFEYIFERQGFRFFYHHVNKGAADFHNTFNVSTRLKDLGAHPVRCCYEIGLVKPSLVRQLLGGAGSSAGAGEQRVARGWGHV